MKQKNDDCIVIILNGVYNKNKNDKIKIDKNDKIKKYKKIIEKMYKNKKN